jgi:ribosomal protein S6--L-glutamate ligase
MLYTRFSQLIQAYHSLENGDVYVGQVPPSYVKHVILADLTSRGVQLIPEAVAQLLNASKVMQAFVLQPWMPPLTTAIVRRKQLLDTMTSYHQANVEKVITKADRLHCGHGIRLWDNLEMMYACLGLDKSAFPFVLQPYNRDFKDLRVIIVGEFCEAYMRSNLHNLRMNLSAGGLSEPYSLTDAQYDLCKKIMQRAQMPHAHIDLMVTPEGSTYLSEIRLNGGIHGAQITRKQLEKKKQLHLMALAEQAGP